MSVWNKDELAVAEYYRELYREEPLRPREPYSEAELEEAARLALEATGLNERTEMK